MPKPTITHDLLRSFGRVQARKLRPEQQGLVDNILPKLAIDEKSGADIASAFDGKFSKFCVEIGFGRGEHLAGYAKNNPDTACIGCEPFINGVARLLKYIDEDNIPNIRILHGDARLLLQNIPDETLDKVFILFPDPWPKARHHKKRIINNSMLAELYRVVKKGGSIEIATDHVEYGQWIDEHLTNFSGLKLIRNSTTPPDDWIRTNYQAKAERAGRGARFFEVVV